MGRRILVALALVAAVLLGWEMDKPHVLSARGSPTPWTAPGGIPLWPWEPGGIEYHPPQFTATPYAVHAHSDATVPKGQRLVIEPGSPGLQYRVGSSRWSIRPAIPALIAIGTAPVHQLTEDRVTYHYDRVVTMITTAYNGSIAMNGPSGAVAAWNGEPLRRGDVAVDPSVIPLGTYLYIDGYGPARAVDTGSAVIGEHVDLFFNESAAAVSAYGIQSHKVYFLTGRPPGFSA
jgi:3D (Asp-Asp-Asp) domain-containing protein